MKLKVYKRLAFLFVFFIPVFTFGQITITQSDLPGVGSFYLNATDSFYNAAILPGGAAQNWNYSTLQNVVQDTLGFISPVGTPYTGLFPTANLAAHDTTAYVYFTASATGFYINGAQVPGGVFNGHPLIYNPAQKLVPAPFTYLDTDNNFYRFIYSDTTTQYPLTDSVRIVRHVAQTMTCDGYGSLTLPNGVHPNTIRIKTIIVENDSIFAHNTITGSWLNLTNLSNQTSNFRWLQNGSGSLLLSIDADSAATTGTTSSYLLLYGVVGINQLSETENCIAYPCPANDHLQLDFGRVLNAPSQVRIINVIGQEMGQYDVSNLKGLNLNTSSFPNGIYFYTITCGKDKYTTGSFQVQRE